jgi:hypothetical protein
MNVRVSYDSRLVADAKQPKRLTHEKWLTTMMFSLATGLVLVMPLSRLWATLVA